MRAVFCAAVLAAPVFAQPPLEPKDGRITIPLSVSPAASPPVLSRYLLTPQYADKQPGQKLTGFLGVFMEQDIFFNAENSKKREGWLALPMGQLPLKDIDAHSIRGGLAYDPKYATMMVRLDQAARYSHNDWNEYFNLRKDGINFLLPEVQKLRSLAHVLKLRLRCEVQAGEFEKAVVTVKTMFGLAQMLETHPTLIGYLVGLAVSTMAIDGLEEMIARPECPNLFWSFAALQPNVLDIRNAVQGERMFVAAQFADLFTGRPATEGEMAKFFKLVDEVASMEPNAVRGIGQKAAARTTFAARAADPKKVAAAKEYLKSTGLADEKYKDVPPLQVAVLFEIRKYEDVRDECMRSMSLPYWVGAADLAAAEATIPKLKTDLVLAPALIPAVAKVRQAQARTDQRVAYLMAIEAVRFYAAANGGKLPAALADTKLPVPVDPASGKPFDYAVSGETAMLSGTNANPGDTRTNRHYAITLRK